MKRLFDFIVAIMLLILLIIPMLFIAIAIRLTSKGPIIYWSDRVGRDNLLFKMPKFRSMQVETPPLATHLMKDPSSYLSPIGAFLRQSSLDELPQLFSIIKGDMSLVGPRPLPVKYLSRFNSFQKKRMDVKPGITGLAQVNGRNQLSWEDRFTYDIKYTKEKSFFLKLGVEIFPGFPASEILYNEDGSITEISSNGNGTEPEELHPLGDDEHFEIPAFIRKPKK